MKVNQIAGILNDIFKEVTGVYVDIPNPDFDPDSPVGPDNPETIKTGGFDEDLSNIVDIGRTITSSTDWGNNFDNYVARIIDKIGRTIFVDRTYSADSLGLEREDWQYGSVMEKIRVEVGDFVENDSWKLARGKYAGNGKVTPGTYPDDPTEDDLRSMDGYPFFGDLFAFDEPAEVQAKYFNLKTTFRAKIILPRNQMESAFRSASAMQRFFGAIENRIRTKMEVSKEALEQRVENNFIAAKLSLNNGVVNLLTEYAAASGDTSLTAATALESPAFLRYCVRRIKTDKKLLARFSGMYNVEGYGTFTPDSKLKVFALTDFATAMETVLRSQTYHDAFVKLDGYKEVPYWQFRIDSDDNKDSFTARSSIMATPLIPDSDSSEPTKGDPVSQSGIVFIMQDIDAAMICQEDAPVDVIYNPDGRFYKYFYNRDASYYNDLCENGIVYIIEDEGE